MGNLLNETIKDIQESGHSIEDIIFIGSEESGHSCTWGEFSKMADKIYDSGFGQEVASDLKIVFSDGSSMWRGEYDGSEYWNYSAPFKRPKEKKEIISLFAVHCWESLEEINTTKETSHDRD